MKKVLSIILAMTMVAGLTACAGSENEVVSDDAGAFGGTITVISREDGSGTRGAFIELTGVEQKNAAGEKEDFTTVEAVIASKTDAVLTNVSGDEMAIGYISMGSMNDTVKAVKVDGVEATTENVKNGSYGIARPFNVATRENPSDVTADFISFMLSAQGQQLAAEGYITVDDAAAEYTASDLSGKITVSGSSSVSPLVEKMIEAYTALNPRVEIELITTDSTGGMNDAANGVSDIGMASRELKESEKQQLVGTTIAMDGIAVIVNKENPAETLTVEQIKAIYTGEVTEWEEIK
ncbi:MAG: substrate-binding domain-containing protein [Oscillospiraceae bacterium]|nr:substrate-binding domain-containing protein [Oscillospiraceae bacterium]